MEEAVESESRRQPCSSVGVTGAFCWSVAYLIDARRPAQTPPESLGHILVGAGCLFSDGALGRQ